MARHAVIIGGGIGGLASALALARTGWTVSVLERSSRLPEGGTALGMWPAAMTALDELGIGERVRQHSALSAGAALLDPSGAVLARVPRSQRAHLISRGRLLAVLHDALPDDTVQWEHPFDGTAIPDADLIVGADGIRSAVRAHWWGSAPARPLGTVAFRGVVEGGVDSVSETWGDGALFGITPSSDERTNWFACLRQDDGLTDADLAAALRHRFSTWHPAVVDVLSRVTTEGVDRRDLHDVSLKQSYARGRVALLGDAAHAMAPNLGRGACESLIDAVTLARSVASDATVPAGLLGYDRARRRRTRRLVAAARTMNRVATARRGIRVRNGAMKLLLPG